MRAASKDVLQTYEIDVDAQVVRYPDRFTTDKGAELWATVLELLE
jgi:hypothetical protein